MRVFDRLNEPIALPSPVVTIGNFDGVHRGHGALIGRVLTESAAIGGTSTVLTFDPHPMTVINPYMRMEQITPLPDKLAILESMGVAAAVVLRFDDDFAKIDPEMFVTEYVHRKISARKIVIGYDFAFGRNKEGSIALFRTMGIRLGFEVIVVEPLLEGDRVISSTRIRSMLKEGRMDEAALFLGRRYTLKGMVVKGKKIGRMLGFPTANLMITNYLIPSRGVYAAYAVIDGARYKAVLSVGPSPTFHISEASFEVHLLDFGNRDIYGSEVTVEFVARLRGVEKFDDAEALKKQIVRDVERATEHLR